MTDVQMRIPAVGEEAPDFTLLDTERQPVHLRDLRGSTVVLVFYPAAFTSVCTTELCTFRDHMADLNEANAVVLGISVDLPDSLAQFKQNNSLNFRLLSDFDRLVIQAYGVVNHNFLGFTSGVARRAVFIIDPQGLITWEWISDHPGQQPEYGDVLEHLGAI